MYRKSPYAILFALLFVCWLSASFGHAKPAGEKISVVILAHHSNMERQAVVDLNGKSYKSGKGAPNYLQRDPALRDSRRNLVTPELPFVIGELTGAWIHHEFSNAETSLLVGEEIGQGMVERLCENETLGWRTTRTIDAAEAHQAAAADDEFVFAITNKRVAKYDRKTGKRLAASRGESKHLNSGFLWDGKLYCAHSNYPATPEASEIKVLDLNTMELITYKDFGNFGGSLTWAVRYADHWWCNFARYGKQNHQTFLVKFDADWKEKGRWTYPDSVVGQLGRYSLSGGIWHDGELLVTGHDDPVVFRLRLPTDGAVLEHTGKLPVPFTGQGLAYDPATGGLVGINRGKRQVVFAEEASE